MLKLQWNDDVRWSKERGLHVVKVHDPVALGTYQRVGVYTWRLRVKRPDGTHTWLLRSPHQDLIKRIKTEALLLGVPL